MPDAASANPQPQIGVVVVNWNGWRNTLAAYESLVASDYANWTLMIVDNASADESVQKLSVGLKNTVLLTSAANLGFAGGCNLGIAKILELGLEYVFLLNSDATVSADALNQLVATSIELGDRAVLGSVVRYSPSGKIQFFGSRRCRTSGRPAWYQEAADAPLLQSKLIETDFVFGAALFAPTAIFRKIGVFDARFFLNFEETDWCYRATAAGIARYVVSGSLVHHQGGASLGDLDAPMQTYFLHRNRLLFNDKHASALHRLRGYAEVTRYFGRRLGQDLKAFIGSRAPLAPSTRALALALRDYTLRRFGDCPPAVRELAKMHRKRAGVR